MQEFRSPNRRFEFHKRGQLFMRTHNETLSVSMALCHKETVQQTARDQELHGDLTWRGGHESARCSSNRLSAPVECTQFVAKEFQYRILHFVT